MKPGRFEIELSNVMRIDFRSVRFCCRQLRKAGQVATGGRGPSAPDMSFHDAAAAMIALMVKEVPGERASDFVRTFGGLVYHGEPENLGADTLEALRGLRAPFTLLDGVAALLSIYAVDPLAPGCEVEVYVSDQPHAKIRFGRAGYYFQGPLPTLAQAQAASQQIPPVNTVRWITDANLRPLAAGLAPAA